MSLLSALADLLKPAPLPDAQTRQALTRVLELVDPLLATTRGFERTLISPVAHALRYCEQLVNALPGPLQVERRSFATDPLVHALFATGDDIDRMLGKSQAVRDFLDDIESHATDHFYALFAARRVEKRQLGVEVHGETIQSDVPQTVLYFADHTLTEPASSLEAARARLRSATFASLLKTFRAHLNDLRAERDGVRSHLSAERAHLSVLRSKGVGQQVVVQTRRIEALDTRLREVAGSLMSASVVQALADFLAAPEQSLSLEACTLKVDRMGVLASAEDFATDADTLAFPELIARDRRRYLVTLARIECEEARRSVKDTLDRQRRFIII